jgi:type I restriction enzyme S subunit
MSKQTKLDTYTRETIGNAIEDQEGIRGPYDLPEGWKWVRLGDKKLFHIETGSTPKTNVIEYWERGNIKWVTPRDLGKVIGKFIFDTERKITQKGLESCSTTIVPKGSIIISTRAPIGHIAIAGDNMCFNQGCKAIVIRDANHVLSDFVYYTLLTKVEEMNALGSGATFKEISRKKLATILIPLPPLEEQRRIVSRLEQLVNRAEEVRRLRKQAREEAEKIMQAALNKVFSRVEEEGWELAKLKELVLIESGKRPKGGSTETGVPSLGGEQLLPTGEVNWEKLRYIPEDFFDTLKKGKVKQGDVLVVKDGATTGKTAYVESLPFKKVAVNEHVFVIRSLDESRLINKYLFFILFSEVGQKQIRDLFHGAAQGGITQHNVEEILIPLPSLEEQKRIIVYLDELRKIMKSLAKLQQKTEEELEKLVPSILDKAFKGGL